MSRLVGSVNLHGVAGTAQLSTERVIMEAADAADLKDYAVVDVTYAPNGGISAKQRHVHWFHPRQVLRGDFIVLWTKRGTNSTTMENGRRVHNIFWNLDHQVWNNTGDAVTLLWIAAWTTIPVVAAAGVR